MTAFNKELVKLAGFKLKFADIVSIPLDSTHKHNKNPSKNVSLLFAFLPKTVKLITSLAVYLSRSVSVFLSICLSVSFPFPLPTPRHTQVYPYLLPDSNFHSAPSGFLLYFTLFSFNPHTPHLAHTHTHSNTHTLHPSLLHFKVLHWQNRTILCT